MASSSAVQDDGDLGPQVIAVISIFTSLATLAVAGRFYARALKGLAFGIDDWMTLVALVSRCKTRLRTAIDFSSC